MSYETYLLEVDDGYIPTEELVISSDDDLIRQENVYRSHSKKTKCAVFSCLKACFKTCFRCDKDVHRRYWNTLPDDYIPEYMNFNIYPFQLKNGNTVNRVQIDDCECNLFENKLKFNMRFLKTKCFDRDCIVLVKSKKMFENIDLKIDFDFNNRISFD
jgi:hypothetical protein